MRHSEHDMYTKEEQKVTLWRQQGDHREGQGNRRETTGHTREIEGDEEETK